MTSLRTVVDEVAALVAAMGIRTVTSPNDMNPPCALVGAPYNVEAAYALGAEEALAMVVPVELITRGLTDRDLTWLYDTIPAVMVALSAATCEPTAYRMSDGRELPAYTITTEVST